MKTTQAAGRQISVLLIAFVALFGAINVQAANYTAAISGNWNGDAFAIWGVAKTSQTGTIFVNNTSTSAVVGTGTSFTTTVVVGDSIYAGSTFIGIVGIITDNTHLSLAANSLAGVPAGTAWFSARPPTSSDTVTIPSGKTITIQNSDPRTLGSVILSGQLSVGSGSGSVAVTVGGDMTVNSGGILKLDTQNAQGITYNGNVTNNGATLYSANGSTTYTYAGGTVGSPKYLVGNITNVIAKVTGVYVNLGNLVTGSGQQVTGLQGTGGSLTNLGVIYYGGNAVPSITTLITTNTGSAFICVSGSGQQGFSFSGKYYNLNYGAAGGTPSLASITDIYYNLTLAAGVSTWPSSLNFAGTLLNNTGASSSSSAITMTGNTAIGGSQAITASGVISGSSKSLAKFGTGTATLKPTSTAVETYTGNTVLYGGSLIEDYTGGTITADLINNASALSLGGPAFAFQGGSATFQITGRNAATTLNQTFNGATINPGGYVVTIAGGNAGATFNLHLGTITRSVAGGAVNFTTSGSGTRNIMTTQINNNGIIGPYAIFQGTDFATGSAAGSDTTIAPVSATALPTSGGTSTVNYSLAGSQTQSSDVTGNTLKLTSTTTSQSLALGTANLTVNGLAYSTVNAYTISGSTGILGAGSGNEFIIHQNSAGTLTIGAPLIGANNGRLTKVGTGNLTLTGASSYTGNTVVGQGTLQLGAGGSINNSTSINVLPGATFTVNGTTTTPASQDLAGSGTINGGALTLGASGTIHPGGAGQYGTLTFASGLTLPSTATATFDLDAQQSPQDDQIAVTGTLTCGSANVVINPGPNFGPGTYILATASTAVSGTFNPTVSFASGAGTVTLSYTATSVILKVTSYASCATPALFTVGGGTNCSDSGLTLTLSGSEIGTTYFVRTNGVANGILSNSVSGGALSFPVQTDAGTYTLLASNSCGNTLLMTGSAVVNPAINTAYNLTGGDGCSSPGVIIGLSGSQSGVTYTLLTNGVATAVTASGTGSTISFPPQTFAATYTVQGGIAGCSTLAMVGSPNTVTITPTPSAPTGVSATAGDNQVSVGWTPPGGPVTGYNVYRSTTSGAETFLASAGSSPYVDATAADGTQYFYKITALNGSCESIASAEVAATPNPAYTAYVITDSAGGNLAAGGSDTLTITAMNGASPISIGGPIALTFSGLASSPGGAAPTVGGTAFGGGSAIKTVTFSSGVATVDLVAYNAGAGQTLAATDGTHSTADSGGSPLSLTVSQAADSAYRLTGTGSPQVGVNYTVNVALVDQYQNVSAFTGSTNLTFNNTSTLSAGADGSVATVNGVAQNTAASVSFTSGTGSAILVAHKAESGKSVTVTDGSLTSSTPGGTALSLGTIIEGVSARLGISTQPSTTASTGAAFAQQPVIKVLDMYGNVTTSNAQVTATASAGNLQGPAITNAVSGTAAFSGLSLTNVGNITLTFASAGMTSTNSGVITVSASTVAGLAWTTQPGEVAYGSTFSTLPVLKTVDAYGNPTTAGLPTYLTVTLSHPSGSGTLIGTTNYNIGSAGSNGIVTLSDLKIGAAGSGNTLQVSANINSAAVGAAVWLDASEAGTVAGSSPVTAWNDISGNGRNFFPIGNAANGSITNTVTINGHKVMSFPNSGSGQFMTNGTYSLTTNSTTFFIVVRARAAYNTGSWQGPLSTYTSGTGDWNNTGSYVIDTGGAAQKLDLQRNNDVPSSLAVPATGTVAIWVGGFDGSLKYVGQITSASSNIVSSADTQGNFNINRIGVGGRFDGPDGNGSSKWPGEVAEVLVYNSWLAGSDRAAVLNYLSNKWISASYPLGPVASTSSAFTVDTAALSITASNQSKAYGQAMTFGSGSTAFTSSGLVNGETIGTVTLAVDNNGDLGTAPVGGSYTITPSAPTGGTFSAANYNIGYTSGTLTVNPAALLITATNQSKIYGQTVTFGSGSTAFTSSGLQNSETIGSVTLAVDNNGNLATAPAGGSYTITPSAAVFATGSDANYTITYATGLLTVNKATPTVTTPPTAGTIIYGQTLADSILSGGAATNVNNGDSVAGNFAFTTPGIAPLAGSPNVSVTFMPTDTANYNPAMATTSVMVNPAVLTITASDTNKAYGQTVSFAGTEFTPAGLINGDSVTNVTLDSDGATNTALANTYAITVTNAMGNGLANYVINYVNGTLTVSKATPVLTAPTAAAITYGQTLADSILSGGTATNANNGDPVAGSFAFTTPATAPSVGTAPQDVTFTPTDTANYSNATTTVSVTVNSACSVPTIVGGIDPNGTNVTAFSLVAFALTNVTGTMPVAYQWRNNDVDIVNATNSSYTNLSLTVADAGNYVCVVSNDCGAITSSIVVLTVNPQTPLIATAPTATTSITYGQTLFNAGLTGGSVTNAEGATVTGTFAYTSPSATPNAGTASQGVTFTPDDTVNYTTAATTVSVTVNKATPTATLAVNNSPVTYGGLGEAATVSVTASNTPGAVANILTGGTASQTNAGTYVVTADYVPDDTANYNTLTAVAAGNFIIQTAPASVTANSASKTYGDANPALTAATAGTVNGDTLNYTLATDATQFSSVGVSNITVTLGSNPNYSVLATNSTLTISAKTASVTADNATKIYGQTITFAGTEFTTSGFVGGDTVTSVTLASDGAVNTAAVNDYPITASAAAGSGLGNYNISYVDGTLAVTAGTPLTINTPVILVDGNVQLTFTGGDAGVSYEIQASTNLSNTVWNSLVTNTAGISGLSSYTDLDATNHAIRFYRTVTP